METMIVGLRQIQMILSLIFPLWAGALVIGAGCYYGVGRLARDVARVAVVFPFLAALFLAYTCYIFGQWFFQRYFVYFTVCYLILLAIAVSVMRDAMAARPCPCP